MELCVLFSVLSESGKEEPVQDEHPGHQLNRWKYESWRMVGAPAGGSTRLGPSTTPRFALRIGAVPLDLPLGDDVGLADETRAEPSGPSLMPQRRSRQPEPGRRLNQREHASGQSSSAIQP